MRKKDRRQHTARHAPERISENCWKLRLETKGTCTVGEGLFELGGLDSGWMDESVSFLLTRVVDCWNWARVV
jgi:hypothetical protein